MSKKKLLIYYPESMLKPVGGPAGYLFNLRQGLDTLNKEELPIDVSFYEAAPKSLRDTVKNKDKIPKRLREFRRAVDDIFYEKKAYPLDEKLYQYDMIHFHSIDTNLFCVDIVCHGVPSTAVWKSYLHWQEQKNHGKAVKVDFRNKKDFGWHDHVETIEFENGKFASSRVFRNLFYGHMILRPSCPGCKSRYPEMPDRSWRASGRRVRVPAHEPEQIHAGHPYNLG